MPSRPVASNVFRVECERTFSQYGRNWKTACAKALGIGRATLYRYLDREDGIPQDVRQRLMRLSAPVQPPIDSREMVSLYARALIDLQLNIDESSGKDADPYPDTLRRTFDRAAALNASAGSTFWPVDPPSLLTLAQKPLYEWGVDLTWDPHGDWTAARFVSNGAITADCFELAARGEDPEGELKEQRGYELLRSVCLDRSDGEEFYRAWRRMVIANPVLQDIRAIIRNHPVLEETVSHELLPHFYRAVPSAFVHSGKLSLCKITGTILRPLDENGKSFETDSRDPRAIRLARMGRRDALDYAPGTLQLTRPFRIFWCLPGITEVELERKLTRKGWVCRLWPALDRVDIVAASENGKRRIAADVKDYLSPAGLARRFEGFKEFASDHECFLVIPDYLAKISPSYERRFKALRASLGKPGVELKTLSVLLHELTA
jgi:hypothetical protein